MTAPPPMYYAELPVAPELAPWLAAHWTFRVRPGIGEIEHTIPLTGGVQLSVSSTRVLLAGPRSEPLRTVVRGGEVFWGSHLWPGAAPSLLGLEEDGLSALVGTVVPAAPILGGAWCRSLVQELGTAVEGAGADVLDAAWSRRRPSGEALDGPVMGAVFRLLASGGALPVPDLARGAGLSPRHFRRRFRTAVGLSPKELARIQRLRTSAVGMVRMSGSSWAELAAEHGYADQAHLVREYRRLLGLTPTRFRRHADSIEHGSLLR